MNDNTNKLGYISKLYGRRQNHPLKPRQERLMREFLPRVSITLPETGMLDLDAMFPGKRETWLEIGFGSGEHIAWQARNNPGIGLIGAEIFINGVAKLLGILETQSLNNVRICFGDARPLIEALPDGALSRIFVLYPDPWPKRRHYKRRMISPWFLEQSARLLRKGGELRIASDIPDYARWTLMHAQRTTALTWSAECAAGWLERPADWLETRYEAKALKEGRAPAYLTFRRS